MRSCCEASIHACTCKAKASPYGHLAQRKPTHFETVARFPNSHLIHIVCSALKSQPCEQYERKGKRNPNVHSSGNGCKIPSLQLTQRINERSSTQQHIFHATQTDLYVLHNYNCAQHLLYIFWLFLHATQNAQEVLCTIVSPSICVSLCKITLSTSTKSSALRAALRYPPPSAYK